MKRTIVTCLLLIQIPLLPKVVLSKAAAKVSNNHGARANAKKVKSKPKPTSHKSASATVPAAQPTKIADLTWLIYMAGDNNLEPYIDFNKKQLEKEGVPDTVNLLLFMCTHRAHEPKMAIKAIVKGHKTHVIEKIYNVDSGDKKTVIESWRWGSTFKAKNYVFTAWDHGFGPLNKMARRGICYDNTTGHFLSDSDLRDAAEFITKNYLDGKKFDGIFFDACLMGAAEIMYAVQPYARYMIASEQTIPAVGWPYHLVLRAYKQGHKDQESFGRAILSAYKMYYDKLTQDYTLSLVNLEKFPVITENVNAVCSLLLHCIEKQKNNCVTKILNEAFAHTVRFDEQSYADLYDWYHNILVRTDRIKCVSPEDTNRIVPHLKNILSQGLVLISQVVIASVQGSLFANAKGMFAYLPQKVIDRTYPSCLWAQQTQWTKFLQAYLNL